MSVLLVIENAKLAAMRILVLLAPVQLQDHLLLRIVSVLIAFLNKI